MFRNDDACTEVPLACVMTSQVGPCPITGVPLWGALMLVCRQKPETMTVQGQTMGFDQLNRVGKMHQVRIDLTESIWIRPPADSNELYRYVYLFQVNIVSSPLQVCQHVPMDRIEMKTKATNTIIPTGLLVRVWEQGTEPDLRNPLHYRSPVDPSNLP